VWNDQLRVQDLVGCAGYSDEKGMRFEAQRFENGAMIWTDADMWDNQGVVWVLFEDAGTYSRVPDGYRSGEAEPEPLAPRRTNSSRADGWARPGVRGPASKTGWAGPSSRRAPATGLTRNSTAG
jgi:hypothetical protein